MIGNLATLHVRVISPWADISLDPGHDAERRVADVVLTTTAFDVAAVELDRPGANSRDLQRSDPGRGQQGVGRRDIAAHAKQPAGCDLRDRGIVVEAGFQVSAGHVVDVIPGVGRSRVPV